MHEKMLQSSSLTLDSTVSVAKGTVVPVPAYAHITLDIFFFYLYHFFCQLCLGRVSGITTLATSNSLLRLWWVQRLVATTLCHVH